MGLLFKARGNASFGIFLIRFVIGLIFIVAGSKKAMHIEAFINYVKSLDILSDNLSFILGFVLPFVEIFFGALFLIGFLTPFTSIVLSMLEIVFIVTYSQIYSVTPPYSISPIAYNLLMLAGTIHVLFSGAGIASFDALLDRKKDKKLINVSETTVPPPPPISQPVVNEPIAKDADFKEIKE